MRALLALLAAASACGQQPEGESDPRTTAAGGMGSGGMATAGTTAAGAATGGDTSAPPAFQLTLLSTTAYGNRRTNATASQQSSIVTDKTARDGYVWRYGAWYDRAPLVESRLWLFSQRRPAGDAHGWQAPTLRASSGMLNPTNAAADEHNSPSLGVDEEGRLVVMWNGHWQEFQYGYWRGSGPGDIDVDSNSLAAGLPADCSYPKLFNLADGSLCMTARLGVLGSGTQGLWELDASSGDWIEVSNRLISMSDASPYMQHVHVNPSTGLVHFSFCVAEGQNTTTYRDCCYFTGSRAAGPGSAWTFRDASGVVRSPPITDAADFVAQRIPLNRGLQVHNGLSATADDVPLISLIYAQDDDSGTNRYLVTRDGGGWVRQLVHEVHPTWDLIDANGSQYDPDAPNSEYEQVSQAPVLYDSETGAVHLVYRSNYAPGSAGIPCLMVTSSFAAPYAAWSTPAILVDTPIGDSFPTHDATGWNQFGAATFLTSLLDAAPGGQYPGGAASSVHIADCTPPGAP